MRILQSCYEYPPLGGGGSRVVHGLSRELARRGHEVHVVTMGFRGHPRRENREGVTVHRVPCLRRSEHRSDMLEAVTYLPAALRKIRLVDEELRFDIHHAHFILPDGWNAARIRDRTGLPFVVTAHGSDVPGYNPHRLRLAHVLARPLWRRAATAASAIVCPSLGLSDLLTSAGGDLSATVIPYGFDPARFRSTDDRSSRILVVSRLLKRKGVQYLIRALHDLALDHELHVVGDGPYLPRLRALARKSSTAVTFHGWLDNRSPELRELYESSRVFVLTSEKENFPVALMEAMAAGLAVVTTRGTGCAEVVGDTGVLVDARSETSLRRALLDLTTDPERCRELGAAARLRIETEFSWRVVADRYLALYERHRRQE